MKENYDIKIPDDILYKNCISDIRVLKRKQDKKTNDYCEESNMSNTDKQKPKDFLAVLKQAASDVSKVTERLGKDIASTATNAANSVGESISGSVEKYGGAAVSGVVKAANSVGASVANTAKKVGNQSIKIVDQNGDGKLDQEDIMIVLNSIYGNAINGIPKVSKPVKDIADEYLQRYPNLETAAKK